MGAGLSSSFIFASGFVKSIGKWTMTSLGTTEYWMPIVTALFFLIPLYFFIYLVKMIPEPRLLDMETRTERKPMTGKQRLEFFQNFAFGLVALIITYIFLTAFRDFRDNFAAEIWKALGYGDQPAIFTKTEAPVAIAVLIIMALLVLIKNNYKALLASHLFIILGFVITGLATLIYERNGIDPITWMTIVGFGLFMGYVPFNSIFFDRLISTFKQAGNVGFLIYLADSFGYLGSVGVMFYKNFGFPNVSWLDFFISSAYYMSIFGTFMVLVSLFYFRRRYFF